MAVGCGGNGTAIYSEFYDLIVMCSLQIKIIELPSKTPVCILVPDAKLGMVMCIKLWQVSTKMSSCVSLLEIVAMFLL